MFDKELQKLKREELLQIILAQSRESDNLKQKLEEAPQKGARRGNPGSRRGAGDFGAGDFGVGPR